MKVYIVTGEPFPNGMAATNRIKCYAWALLGQDVEVEVLIFRRTEGPGLMLGNKTGVGNFKGINYRYIGNTSIRKKNPLVWRIIEKIDHYNTIKYLSKNLTKGDVVLFYCNLQLELTLQIMKKTRSKGAKFVRDLCELPFGTGAETPDKIKLRERTYNEQFPLLDGIVSISDALTELAMKYIPNNRIIKVPILVDYNSYKLEDKSDEMSVPFIFHSGTLYEQKDGILGMLEAFGMAVEKLTTPLDFILTGTKEKSPHAKEIDEIISKYDLGDRVKFTGYLSNEDLKLYLSKASLVIINKYETQQNVYCFSTKLGEYLAASKPLIITNVGEAMNWLKNKESAYIIPPKNNNALVNAIVYAVSNRKESYEIGLNGQKVCKNSFDFSAWGKYMVDFFKTL